MQECDILIIDSGFNLSHPFFDEMDYFLDGIGLFLNDLEELVVTNDYNDELGHGTAVTSIFCKSVENPSFFMIKAYNNIDELSDIALIKILYWIKSNINTKVIHMSLGILHSEYKSELEAICQALVDQGVILVAAFDNYGGISYPAAFDCVIGVDYSHRCNRHDKIIAVDDAPINFRAFGISQKLPWLNHDYENVCSSSFSAPYISAKVINLMREGIMNREIIMEQLRMIAFDVIKATPTVVPRKSFEIKKAVVLPFNKEIHSLLRFNDLVNFEIIGFFDFPYTLKPNREAFTKISIRGGQPFVLQSWNKIDWKTDFDTVIVGHLEEFSELVQKDLLGEVLDQCIKYHKNIYTFGSLDLYKNKIEQMQELGLKYYYPAVDGSFVGANWLGKMYALNTPVVCVVGTSRTQGKFSLQLSLRREFKKLDYRVGQIGTEPTAELFDMNYSYPIGYFGEVKTSSMQNIMNVRYLLNRIEDEGAEVIIVGTQSQTITTLPNNISGMAYLNHEFILGASPDVFILHVNLDDDLEFIKKSVAFCESISQGKVIAITISSIVQNARWSVIASLRVLASAEQIADKITELKAHFAIAIFADYEIEPLTQHLIDYLSEEG